MQYMLQFACQLGAAQPGPHAGERAIASAPTLEPAPV